MFHTAVFHGFPNFRRDKTTGARGMVVDSTPVSHHIQSAPLTTAFRSTSLFLYVHFSGKAQCRLSVAFNIRRLNFDRRIYKDTVILYRLPVYVLTYCENVLSSRREKFRTNF